jgi:quinol monooxygenase YgiN
MIPGRCPGKYEEGLHYTENCSGTVPGASGVTSSAQEQAMKAIQLTARAAIHDGKLEEFKVLAAQCLRKAREQDSGTLQYDWFLNGAQTECVVRETYRDSEAVLEHIANLGASLGAILAVCDWTFEVFGSPSPELVAAAAGLSLKVYSPFQSM